jgi:hypothetical protein
MKKTVYRFILAGLVGLAMLAGCEDIASGVKSLTDTYKVQTDESILHGTITVTPENAKAGDTVTIMVTPDENYRLKADSLKVNDGAVAINGTANPYIFTMPASDVTVTAEFEELPAGQYSVTIGNLTNGSISAKVEGVPVIYAAEGAQVTLTVTPAENYRLKADSLKVNEGAVTVNGSGNTYTFTMPASDVTVTAEFEELPAGQYSVTIGDLTHGGIGTDKTSAAEGDTVTLTVTPEAGYQYTEGSLIVTKTGSGEQVTLSGSDLSYTFTMPANNVTVTATFTAISYTINITDPGNGNSVSADPSGSATVGTTVTLTVTPADGYQLQSITVTKADSGEVEVNGSNNTRTFTMPASNVTVAAVFEVQSTDDGTYTITLASLSHGHVTGPSNLTVAAGTQYIVIIAHPDMGYQYVANSITVTKASGGTVSVSQFDTSGSFTMPADNVTVTAQFTAKSYTITISQPSNGSITAKIGSEVKDTATVEDTITLTATPASNYVLQNVSVTPSGGGTVSLSGEGNTRMFVMPASDVTVSAIFGQSGTYSINIPTFEHGTVGANSESAAAGTTITLTVTPENSYRLVTDSLTVTESGNSPVTLSGSNNTYTFMMPASNVTVGAEFEPNKYSITIDNEIDNGNVSASSSQYPNYNVSITVTPSIGYILKEGTLTVTRNDNNESVAVSLSNDKWTFTMPASNVTVTAQFEAAGLIAGLYELTNDVPGDAKTLSGSGTMLANALAWIKANGVNKKSYLILLDTSEAENGSGYIIGADTSTGSSNNTHTGTKLNLSIKLMGTTEGITISKTAGTTGPLLTVSGYGVSDKPTLILENITLAGHSNNNSPLVLIGTGTSRRGILKMESGSTITGNNGGGVSIAGTANCEFTMNGGTIKGNSATNGAAVYGGTNAKFTKTGGTIYGNEETDGNANTPTDPGHVIESGSNWRDSTAGPNVNTADANFWENN